METKKFESKFGFNANNETLVNLGNPVDEKDGVNKWHYDYFKGVLGYDQKRGYPSGSLVIYDNELFISLSEIAVPSGNFNKEKWGSVKNPPSWRKIDKTQTELSLKSSDYIVVDTSLNQLKINLPTIPHEGQSVFIYDVGGNVGYKKLEISSNKRNINLAEVDNGEYQTSVNLTSPNSIWSLTFINGLWMVRTYHDSITSNKSVKPNSGEYYTQSGDVVKFYGQPSQTPLNLNLPIYANHGDMIKFISVGRANTFINVNINKDASSKIDGLKTVLLSTYKDLCFIYDSTSMNWNSVKSVKDREVVVTSSSYKMMLNQDVFVQNNSITETDINLTLPESPSKFERVELFFPNVSKFINLTIVSPKEKIYYDSNNFGAVSSSTHYTQKTVEVQEIKFNPDDVRLVGLQFIFDGVRWTIGKCDYFVYKTDPKTPQYQGLIALVNDSEIIADVMTNGNVAITPSQLQKRYSTEKRYGLSKIATQDEVLKGVDDTKFITPLKLHETKSSESQQGVAKIASQNEVDLGKDHTKIVSPLTLDMKLPNETGKRGVVSLVSSTNVSEGADRQKNGKGIYDKTDSKLVVTPKTLSQLIASEISMGISYKATVDEVLNGVADEPKKPLFVSPFTLSSRVATTERTGLAKLTSKTTVLDVNNSTDIVNPSTLHSVQATHDLKGLAKFWDSSKVTPLGTTDNGLSNVKEADSDMKIVSQNSLNDILSFYLPKTATASNSEKVGGNGVDNLFLLNRSHVIKTKQTINTLVGVDLTYDKSSFKESKIDKVIVGGTSLVHGETLKIVSNSTGELSDLSLSNLNVVKMNLSNGSEISGTVDSSKLGFGGIKTSDLLVRKENFDLFKYHNGNKKEYAIVDTENMKRTIGGSFASLVDDNTFKNVNSYTKPVKFSALANRSLDGYIYHIFEANSADITNNNTWLMLPPTNVKSYSVVNGSVVYVPDGVAKYDKDYIYESFRSKNQIHERLSVGDKKYTRCTDITTNKNNGWDMVYTVLNKPTPLEINAVDRDELLVGSIQVKDYLDIVVDENNTFRIKPDKDAKKVIYAWLEKAK